jgi:uncharacterized membrane protein (DUF2068 family)
LTVPQRPFGVALLAVLHVLQAILFFLGGLVLLVIGSLPRMMFRFPRHGGLLSIIGVVLLILAVLYVGFAWGLWNGKGWAWILSLVLAAIGVLIAILSLIRGGLGSILVLLIDVIILYYLTQPNVKAFFGEAEQASLSMQRSSGQVLRSSC